MESKIGRDYWDRCWNSEPLPRPIDIKDGSLRNHLRLALHAYFVHAFSIAGINTNGKKLIEIGCGRSIWLPHFAGEFGFHVYGIDYTESGCTQAHAMFAAQNMHIDVELICGDAFEIRPQFLGGFDVVFSNGFVEHFPDTAEVLLNLSRYLKTGGTMITIIPNMTGAIGWIQKLIDIEVYDTHVPLSARDLADFHEAAGLEVIDSRYLITMGFNILNPSRLNMRRPINYIKKALVLCLVGISAFIWFLERWLKRDFPSRMFSPYIATVARQHRRSNGSDR